MFLPSSGYYYSDKHVYQFIFVLGDEISRGCINVPSELCGVLKKTSTFFRFRTGKAFSSAGIRVKVSFGLEPAESLKIRKGGGVLTQM